MSNPEPNWKAAEKLVAAIEKSLAPDAIVEHNVQLPVLGQKRSRQCDVVLRAGKKPRDQLFIIEVQQRGSKPDINTFGGWLRKMEEVGASGLICVSEAGFPDSIIQDVAERIGPKVKLVTLNPQGENFDGLSLYLVPEFVRSVYKIRDVDLVAVEFYGPAPNEVIASGCFGYLKEKAWSHYGDPSKTFPLTDLIKQGVHGNEPYYAMPGTKIGTKIDVRYTAVASDDAPLWIHADQGIFRLKSIAARATVQRLDESEPMVYSKWSYIQEFHDSKLAWAASSSFDVEGVTVKMTLIFIPDDNGFLRPSLELEAKPKAD